MDRHLPGQKRTALTLMLLCAWLLPASAQVQFEARIDSLELLIGEQTGITLDLTCGKGQKAALPQLKANVEIISASTPDTSLLNEGKRVEVTQRIMVAAWDSSLYCLPPFEATVDGKAYRTKSLALKVLPVEPLDTAHLDKFYPH